MGVWIRRIAGLASLPCRVLAGVCTLAAMPCFGAVDFVTEVQPVLTAKCLGCHAGASAQAGLRLHTRADLLTGGASGAAIVPGKSEDLLSHP